MASAVFDSIRAEMERFIQLKTDQMKQEMLLIMDTKLNELRKQLGSMDTVEGKQAYLPKSGVSSLGDDRLHVHELERVNVAEIDSCIDQLYVESITSLNHDTLQQHFALPSAADHSKENAAVPPKASQKDAKPISLKCAKNAKPLAEINGQVEHHRAKAATRKQGESYSIKAFLVNHSFLHFSSAKEDGKHHGCVGETCQANLQQRKREGSQ